MRILIAEDDSSSRSILVKMLSGIGECDVAVDGREAINAYKNFAGSEKAYDLLCLDLKMPEVDGNEVLKQIRLYEAEQKVADDKSIRVIITTVLRDPETVIDAVRGGCESYVTKPIGKEQLFGEIRRLGFEIT